MLPVIVVPTSAGLAPVFLNASRAALMPRSIGETCASGPL